MFNTQIPTQAELPSTRRLLRSTAIAAVTAAALLVAVVLPAEYGIDPTGAGRVLGLTEMGEIKAQLAEEAEEDRLRDLRQVPAADAPAPSPTPDRRSSLMGALLALSPVSVAQAAAPPPVQVAQAERKDETSVTLKPGEGAEVKMAMRKGAEVAYSWKVEGGGVNHDTHGEPHDAPNKTHSYSKGRGVQGDEGTLVAAFDGSHGWFWRNRTSGPVTVRLTVSGAYENLRRLE